jgi:hypothetical protein
MYHEPFYSSANQTHPHHHQSTQISRPTSRSQVIPSRRRRAGKSNHRLIRTVLTRAVRGGGATRPVADTDCRRRPIRNDQNPRARRESRVHDSSDRSHTTGAITNLRHQLGTDDIRLALLLSVGGTSSRNALLDICREVVSISNTATARNYQNSEAGGQSRVDRV